MVVQNIFYGPSQWEKSKLALNQHFPPCLLPLAKAINIWGNKLFITTGIRQTINFVLISPGGNLAFHIHIFFLQGREVVGSKVNDPQRQSKVNSLLCMKDLFKQQRKALLITSQWEN